MTEPEWQTQMRRDPRTTSQLISLALSAADEEEAWKPVQILHFRGNREVFEAARVLSESACLRERSLAADILGQLGVPDRVFPEEVVGLLIQMLEREEEPAVLHDIAVALGHQHSPSAAVPLARLRRHPHDGVRWSVAYSLAGLDVEPAIAALIELSTDPDDDVRDWATFALGSQTDLDTPAIRAALAARLDDPCEEARGEALVGLARRGDERVAAELQAVLAAGTVNEFHLTSAALIGRTDLQEALLHLARQGTDGEDSHALPSSLWVDALRLPAR